MKESTAFAGCQLEFFIIKKYRDTNFIKKKEVIDISQEELRALYNERLVREKQKYISQVTGIDSSILSKFKKSKIDLYPHLFEKLEAYLLNN